MMAVMHLSKPLKLLLACMAMACTPSALTPTLHYLNVGSGERRAVESLVADVEATMGDKPFAGQEITRHTNASEHIVVVRTREPYHTHTHSDIAGVVLAGHGSLLMPHGIVPLASGDMISIPRGTPHAFINSGKHNAVLYAVFTPPFVAGDRQPVTAPAD